MEIKSIALNFNGKTNVLQRRRLASFVRNYFRTPKTDGDVFVKSETNILDNLKKIKLKEQINAGRSAKVYKTNFDGYVIRLVHNCKFTPKELKPVNDSNGLIIAENGDNTIQLMKFMRGEPLYGNDWKISCPVSKTDYLKTFNIVRNLPDKTFSDYIQKVINLRKIGYDIDTINPNNFLLDKDTINIVDIDKHVIGPWTKIDLDDFNAFVNKRQIKYVIRNMNLLELRQYAKDIRVFYDRMAKIAQEEGYDIGTPKFRYISSDATNIIACLYNKKWLKLHRLVNKL